METAAANTDTFRRWRTRMGTAQAVPVPASRRRKGAVISGTKISSKLVLTGPQTGPQTGLAGQTPGIVTGPISTHTQSRGKSLDLFIYVRVRVCFKKQFDYLCVCEWETDRESERREGEREKEE